jgi:hypothetical protein
MEGLDTESLLCYIGEVFGVISPFTNPVIFVGVTEVAPQKRRTRHECKNKNELDFFEVRFDKINWYSFVRLSATGVFLANRPKDDRRLPLLPFGVTV